MAVHVMVMAGGSGSRFWPRSRRLRPKQLLHITGVESMLQKTVLRVQPLGAASLQVVTNIVQAEATQAQLEAIADELDAALASVVPEPAARNTAPAVALSAALLAREDPEAVMVVLPADHHIGKPAEFLAVLRRAIEAAASCALVTLGITPTRAETGYGYIELGPERESGVHRVAAFREKPDAETAARYVASGRHLWNSGMFIWRVDAILDAFQRHMPELYAATLPVLDADVMDVPAAIVEMFAAAPSQSIDYGVMEKHDDVVALPADIGWSDVGSWASLAELQETDEAGNAVEGDVVLVDSKGCLVQAESRTVAVLGVENLAVVETADAVLVCPLARAQEVRRIVAALEARGAEELL